MLVTGWDDWETLLLSVAISRPYAATPNDWLEIAWLAHEKPETHDLTPRESGDENEVPPEIVSDSKMNV